MSYCRWSTNNFRSDVYVYLSADGYTTHVASNKKVGIVVNDPPWSLYDTAIGRLVFIAWDWIARMNYKLAPRIEKSEPHSGETFIDDTARDCISTLNDLRDHGHNVPECAFEQLRKEAMDE